MRALATGECSVGGGTRPSRQPVNQRAEEHASSPSSPGRASFDWPARTRHTAHKTEIRIVHYRWHPWHGRPVRVRVGERYPGVLRCYFPGDDGYARFLPAWMLDDAACAAMRVAAAASVTPSALEALAQLLEETRTVDGATQLVETAPHGEPNTAGAKGLAATGTERVDAARAAVEGTLGGGPPRRRRAARTAAARRGRARGGGRR